MAKDEVMQRRMQAVEMAMSQIEKNHGKGAVMRLGDEVRQPISVIPTGSIALDVALGIGGLPRGRVVEIYGPESSGKTTVALHAVANAQAAGWIAAFIDAEHALDPDYAQKLGVDTDALSQRMLDEGYLLAPGALFHAERKPSTLMRINFATTQDATFWRDFERVRAEQQGR